MKVYVIVNPASSGGATGKSWPSLKAKLDAALPGYGFSLTQSPGHATKLARNALLDGYTRLIAVGGDGTVNEVVNGFFDGDRQLSPHAELGVIDAGTGGDFRKNIGLPESLDAQIAILASGKSKAMTVGHAQFVDDKGQPQSRYFAVICSFGISSAVNDYVNRSPLLKRYGGGAAFTLAALKTLFVYKKPAVSMVLDGEPLYEGPLLIAAACNGPWTGGGMLMAPGADSFSPQLDFIAGGNLNLYESLMVFPRIYNGTHITRKKVDYIKGSRLSVTPKKGARIVMDMDGEIAGYLPLEIEARAALIKVLIA